MANVLALARKGLSAFFDWWLGELASLVPHQLTRTARADRRGPILVIGRREAFVLEGVSEGEPSLGSVDVEAPDHAEQLDALLRQTKHRRQPMTIRLSAELGLRKILDLPLAAKDDLGQLLRFEIDRLTPFRADEVYFAQRLIGTDMPGRRISVELQVAPKYVVDRALEMVHGLDIVPARIELTDSGSEDKSSLNLLPSEPGRDARGHRLRRALMLLALALGALALAIPLGRQRVTTAELEQQVASARLQAEESFALRERLDRLTQSRQFLHTEKGRRPLMTEVLEELTRVIPDQAHIVQLQLRDGTVQLHGFAETASDLIGLLDQSPLIRAPQFRSPVTQEPRTGKERFHVSVELVAKGGS